jgi:hypothetical protein
MVVKRHNCFAKQSSKLLERDFLMLFEAAKSLIYKHFSCKSFKSKDFAEVFP